MKNKFRNVVFLCLILVNIYFLFQISSLGNTIREFSTHQININDNQNNYLSDDNFLQYEGGKIVFSRTLQGEVHLNGKQLVLMDMNGNNILTLGYYRGVPAISPSGNLLAINCPDNVSMICIININSFDNPKQFPKVENFQIKIPNFLNRISLPVECVNIMSEKSGLTSISWSFDEERLAFVCKNPLSYSLEESLLCFLWLPGEAFDCQKTGNYNYNHVSWSPSDYSLLFDNQSEKGESEIYLFDEGEIKLLANGSYPEWTPDGQSFAFINEGGIALSNSNGEYMETLYTNKLNSDPYNESIYFNCKFNNCRLSWSPDGNYLVFQGQYYMHNNSHIFRLNVKTQEVIILDEYDANYDSGNHPDWGP